MGNIGLEWTLITTPIKLKEVSAAPSGTAILANTVQIYAKDKAGTSALYLTDDAGSEREIAPANIVTGTGANGRVAFWTGTTTISSDTNFQWDNTNKRLGLGGSSDGFRLELKGNTPADADIILRLADNTGGNQSAVAQLHARGTIGSESATQSGDALGIFSWGGFANAAYQFNKAAIGALALTNWSATNTDTYITFSTTPTGSTSRAERFRIGASGQWGIGGATFGTALDVFTSGGASAAPTWTSPGALTKVDDTNVTLTLGGTPTTALLRAASLTLGWTGQLAISRGGTGASTALAAFNALSPLTTRGDLLTRDASNNVRLAVGAANTVLKSNGTDPSWLDYTTDWLSQYALLAGRSGGQTLKGGTAAGDTLKLQTTAGNGVGSDAILFLGGNNGALEFGRWARNSTTNYSLLIGTTTCPSTAQGLVIVNQVSGTRAITVQADGSGSPNSAYQLFTASSSGPTFIMQKGRGSIASPGQTLSGDTLGAFSSRGVDNTPDLTGDMAKFEFFAAENITTTAHGSKIIFTVVPKGSTTQAQSVLFPEDGGIAIVDGITAPATESGWAKIYVDTADGDLKVKFGDGTVKTIVTDT